MRAFCLFLLLITALHGMQMRSSDENSVCPSACLSNACEILGQSGHVGEKSPIFYLFVCSASAVTPREKFNSH